MPPTQLSSRLAARLGQLPHGVLAELAAQLCSDSPALEAAAEECMAAHTPLPHEMVERVLLSPDLVPHILGSLEAEDGAAAVVCSQWLDGWKATNEPRRWLKQVPLDFPEELLGRQSGAPQGSRVSSSVSSRCVFQAGAARFSCICDELLTCLRMSATPDGRLVVHTCNEVLILDRSMRVLQRLTDPYLQDVNPLTADDTSIFFSPCRWRTEGGEHGVDVLRFTQGLETRAAEYRLVDHHVYWSVLAPGGLLFCVMRKRACHPAYGDGERDEIIALDAQTLHPRHRFGLGLLNEAGQLAVGGDELYVCDTNNHRLQVFSLTGEHRRSIVGAWRRPKRLCFAKDRLYLLEAEGCKEEEEDDGDTTAPVQGRRVLVLSLQGAILQVVTHPTEPSARFHSICCFNDKLLARYLCYQEHAGTRSNKCGMLALQGL